MPTRPVTFINFSQHFTTHCTCVGRDGRRVGWQCVAYFLSRRCEEVYEEGGGCRVWALAKQKTRKHRCKQ